MRSSIHALRYCVPIAGFMSAALAHAENVYTLSIGGGFVPRYAGSNQYRGVVAPSFSAEFDNGIFIGALGGVGYRLKLPGNAFVAAAVGYSDGRADENRFDRPGSNYLKGMGNVPGSVVVAVQAGVALYGGSMLSVTVDTPVTHTSRGVSGHVDLAVPVYSAGRHEVVVTGSVHAASGRYTQTFYGVTDAQAAATRFAPYSTKGGIDSASMSVAWTYKFSKHWSVDTTLGLTRVLGRYGNSPIVQQKANYFGLSSLTYRF
ncbi:MipA/OmpV family protein [Burkholderia thailandensis]|nr:MipA/OmpV family protein [Burkholderia thailandensis]MDD1480584.1 MipA/OmpV family protein [Burkholderia thailandensis]MDD1486333.1 MipA/OmpV family protein [Burkholderia thailandensis]MDD1492109.1 MipA/OmpV family protein [Burkholderia thailandensis]PNE78134.1 MipA/OmpV family protein [Burkholderia thailandensis]